MGLPLLKKLYNAKELHPNHLYILLTIILMLSQDTSFNTHAHAIVLTHVPWYKDRILHNISLGSLAITTLVRTVQHNMVRPMHMYIHTNCLAALANMSPHF